MKTKQQIYDEIKSADNKQLFALCGEYANQYRIAKKQEEERDKLKKQIKSDSDLGSIFEDKDALRARVLQHLFQESEKGNAQASDKLARLAGLSESAQDIVIEIIDYKNVIGYKNVTGSGSEASTIKSKSTQQTVAGEGYCNGVASGTDL